MVGLQNLLRPRPVVTGVERIARMTVTVSATGRLDHAATGICWLSTAAIFRQPSIWRNLICPLTTRISVVSSFDHLIGA